MEPKDRMNFFGTTLVKVDAIGQKQMLLISTIEVTRWTFQTFSFSHHACAHGQLQMLCQVLLPTPASLRVVIVAPRQ